MQAIGFLAIFLISLTNLKMYVASAEPLTFMDNDFTDYEEEAVKTTVRQTELSDNTITSREDVGSNKSSYKANINSNFVKLKTSKSTVLDKTPTSLESILKMSEKLNTEKAFLRPKRDVSLSALISIESEGLKPKFRRTNKQNAEKLKALLIERRGISVSIEDPASKESILAEKLDLEEAKPLLNTKRQTILSSKIPESDLELTFELAKRLKPKKAKMVQKTIKEATFLDNALTSPDRNNTVLTFRKNNELTPKQKRAAKKHAASLKLTHRSKVKEIMAYMKHNYMTTNYIYEEMQRIRRQGVIRDNLRLLIQYLEDKSQSKLRESVLKCYYSSRIIDKPLVDVWKNRITNNVVINTLKNPNNHGFIN